MPRPGILPLGLGGKPRPRREHAHQTSQCSWKIVLTNCLFFAAIDNES